MTGILNGTCNYILSKITDEGVSFESALAEAQVNGYAEADPTLDIEGIDAAHKLAILNAISYGMQINMRDTYVEGISKITPMDIEYAGQFGYRIKLLAISKYNEDTVEARIHPTMIPFDNPLSNVDGTLNAVMISGHAVGNMMLYGHGAGMMPTASAVISDIADLARNILHGNRQRVPLLSYQKDRIRDIRVKPLDDIWSHYYIRFSAVDQPGVLSTISGILGKHRISIQSVHQKGRKTKGPVPIVMLTHRSKEMDIKNALSEICMLDIVSTEPVLIRIEDESCE
jgi:homoserine dehydrogenase